MGSREQYWEAESSTRASLGQSLMELADQMHRRAHSHTRVLKPLSRSLDFNFSYPQSIMRIFETHFSLH